MVKLFDETDNRMIGSIDDTAFAKLQNVLEEESDSDTNYFIDADTLELLSEEGLAAEVVTVLRTALGPRDGFEVRWERVN
jgi:hypothetical protein